MVFGEGWIFGREDRIYHKHDVEYVFNLLPVRTHTWPSKMVNWQDTVVETAGFGEELKLILRPLEKEMWKP